MTTETVHTFKLAALDSVDQIIDAVLASRALGEADAVRDLVAVATSLAGSLWQTTHPAPTLSDLYTRDPRLAHSSVDFGPRLEHLLAATAHGLAHQKPTP